MTIKEIKTNIRNAVQQIRQRYESYTVSSEKSSIFEKEYKKLFRKGMGKEKGGKLQPAFSHTEDGKRIFKNKKELEKELKSFEGFLEKDIYSPEGIKAHEEKNIKAYETFVNTYADGDFEDFTIDDWHRFYDEFNKVKDITKGYGYEDFGKDLANLYVSGDNKQRKKFGSTVKKAINTLKKSHNEINTESLLDEIARLM